MRTKATVRLHASLAFNAQFQLHNAGTQKQFEMLSGQVCFETHANGVAAAQRTEDKPQEDRRYRQEGCMQGRGSG